MILQMFFNFGFPQEIPKDMEKVINHVKKFKSKRQAIEYVWKYIGEKYHPYCGFTTYTRFYELLSTDMTTLWDSERTHCTKLNYLIRIILIKSGHFKESDFKINWTLVWWFSPHQFMKIKLSKNNYIIVDGWGYSHRIRLNEYARGFNTSAGFFKDLKKK